MVISTARALPVPVVAGELARRDLPSSTGDSAGLCGDEEAAAAQETDDAECDADDDCDCDGDSEQEGGKILSSSASFLPVCVSMGEEVQHLSGLIDNRITVFQPLLQWSVSKQLATEMRVGKITRAFSNVEERSVGMAWQQTRKRARLLTLPGQP